MVSLSNNPAYSILRVKFKKVGDLQYISHLDLVRTMHRIVVRSGLPLWYTEGFNPKPKMTFAAPLSVGTESLCEFMDVRVTKRLPEDEIVARLNANMTDEMQVIEAYYPERPITDIGYLSYTVEIHTAGVSEELAQKCREALCAPKIEIVKKTKSSDAATVDIKPLIKETSVRVKGEELVIECVLSASPSAFLNPEHVIGYLRSAAGILRDPEITNEWYTVLRTCAYYTDMTPFR